MIFPDRLLEVATSDHCALGVEPLFREVKRSIEIISSLLDQTLGIEDASLQPP